MIVLLKDKADSIRAFRDLLQDSNKVMDILFTGLTEALKAKSQSEALDATLSNLMATLKSYKELLFVIHHHPMYISCFRHNTYRDKIQGHISMVNNTLPMLNLTMVQITTEIASDVKELRKRQSEVKNVMLL